MIKVSIIVPVYNVESFLEECLDSILNQDYKNYEVLLINDGSTDRSLEIANKYVLLFKGKLNIISQINSGLSASRNKGIENAKGTYIYFLDSDDYINKNTLSLCVNYFDLYSVDIVFFDGKPFFDGVDDSGLINTNYIRGVERGVYENTSLLYLFLSGHYIVQACCYMIRRSAYFNNRFPVGILHEDNYFTTKLLCSDNYKSFVLNEVLYNRRFRLNSIMTTKKTIENVNGYLKSGSLLYDDCTNNTVIKKYCYVLYNRALDIIINDNIKISFSYKLKVLREFFVRSAPIKLYVKVLFPKWIKFVK